MPVSIPVSEAEEEDDEEEDKEDDGDTGNEPGNQFHAHRFLYQKHNFLRKCLGDFNLVIEKKISFIGYSVHIVFQLCTCSLEEAL
jgi:hypothetical protein